MSDARRGGQAADGYRMLASDAGQVVLRFGFYNKCCFVGLAALYCVQEVPMPRLSIDITKEEHRRLKASAALEGQSLKDYVITRVLVDAQTLQPPY